MKRRDFLQRAGWTLAALGLSEAQWLQLGNRYYSAIAEPSPRKLAAQISGNDEAGSLQVGQRVRESVRVLPRNIKLTIALDTGLERIERVDATSAFAAIPHISSVIAGEQPADYLFGRVQDASSSSLSSRYGLFSLSQELIPNTTGEVGEAVKVAVQRLAPKLQTLLAAKLWRLTTNETSSGLKVRAALETITVTEQILTQQQTWHESNTTPTKASQGNIPVVSIGSRIQYRVHNDGDRPVYLVLVGLDSNKSAIALYPTSSNEAATLEIKPALKELAIAPGDTLTVPQSEIDFAWIVRGPIGVAQTQLIFSRASFSQTIAALNAAMQPREVQQIMPMLNPLEVAQAVLQDLHRASAVQVDSTTSADTYTLDVNAWASLSFIYQVV